MVYEAKREWAPVGRERLRAMITGGFFDTGESQPLFFAETSVHVAFEERCTRNKRMHSPPPRTDCMPNAIHPCCLSILATCGKGEEQNIKKMDQNEVVGKPL